MTKEEINYKSKVKVKKGFYKGRIGQAINPFGFFEVSVKFDDEYDRTYEYFKKRNLEIIK